MRRYVSRVSAWIDRHRRIVVATQWICFVVSCAAFAGFIDLPAITVPAFVGVGLTFLRYAIWEGWLKTRVLADDQRS